MVDIDKLALISGEPIEINGKITLYQPTLRQIKEFGESKFYSIFWPLCSAAYDMPATFDSMGVDFMSVSDWQFFMLFSKNMTQDQTSLIFGDIDFSKLQQMVRTKPDGEQDIVLLGENEFVIDEELYKSFIPYVREMIGFSHKGKKAGNAATKKILIMEDKKEQERNAKKNDQESMLFNLIISLVNTEEFSYDYKSIFDLTIYQLIKSSTQIQGKKSAIALLQGSMSGFVDTSGIPKSDFSWMYSEDKYKPRSRKLVNQKTTK